MFGSAENQFIYCFFKKLCQLKRFDCSVFPFGEIICKQNDFFCAQSFCVLCFSGTFPGCNSIDVLFWDNCRVEFAFLCSEYYLK